MVALLHDPGGRSTTATLDKLLLEYLQVLSDEVARASNLNQILCLLKLTGQLFGISIPSEATVSGSEIEGGDLESLKKALTAYRAAAKGETPGLPSDTILLYAVNKSGYFAALARVLLYQVVPNWLKYFSPDQQAGFFDVFFLHAPAGEVLTCLASALTQGACGFGGESGRTDVIQAEAERLLALWIEGWHKGQSGVRALTLQQGSLIRQKTDEAEGSNVVNPPDKSSESLWTSPVNATRQDEVVELARILASIPDKAGASAPLALRAPLFVEEALTQLVQGLEEHCQKVPQGQSSIWLAGEEHQEGQGGVCLRLSVDEGPFVLGGELISRFCRRGHVGIVSHCILENLLPRVRKAGLLCPTDAGDTLHSELSMWRYLLAAVRDGYAQERLVESLLIELAAHAVDDRIGNLSLTVLFGGRVHTDKFLRHLFTHTLLLQRVLPLACLRLVFLHAICRSPSTPVGNQQQDGELLPVVLSQLAQVWGSPSFVRTTSMQQQAYVSAAVVLGLEGMSHHQLNSSGGLLAALLQGVGARLESPLPAVRQMAQKVAYTFSLLIDPAKPLIFDEGAPIGGIKEWDGTLLPLPPRAAKCFRALNPEAKAADGEEAGMDSKGKIVNGSEGVMPRNNCGGSEPRPNEQECVARGNKLAEYKSISAEKRVEQTNAIRLEELTTTGAKTNHKIETVGSDSAGWDSDGCGDESSDDSLQPYTLSDNDDELDGEFAPLHLRRCAEALRKPDDADTVERALGAAEQLIRAGADELADVAAELAQALVSLQSTQVAVEGQEDEVEDKRVGALVALLACAPVPTLGVLTRTVFSPNVDVGQRIMILDVMASGAQELASSSTTTVALTGSPGRKGGRSRSPAPLIAEVASSGGTSSGTVWYGPGSALAPQGAGPWEEAPGDLPSSLKVGSESSTGWAHRYERELPQRKGVRQVGKSRRWGKLSPARRFAGLRGAEQRQNRDGQQLQVSRQNQFGPLAALFMLPLMREFDKVRHGVNWLGRDFVVLGRLLHLLGICVECAALQPDVPSLATALLDMLQSRAISQHQEAFVRRAALFAASRVLLGLPPSFVVSALSEDIESPLGGGLDWMRAWASRIADDDPDQECSSMAMFCLQLHRDLAARAMDSLQMESNSSPAPTQVPMAREMKFIIPL